MTIGLGVCFSVAFFVGQAALSALEAGNRNFFMFNPVFTIALLIGYFILAFAVQPVVLRSSINAGIAIYLGFAAVFGLMISVTFAYFMQTSPGSVYVAFIATAAMFGAMTIYGYTTKADLSRWGNILAMGVLGIIIASIVNWFVQSPAIFYLVSYAGVLIFCGFVAYDTQWIKTTASDVAMTGDPVAAQRVALLGAFHLFYDFVQLFMFILRIIGFSRD
jgi:FtsH-binding integral membrane protein